MKRKLAVVFIILTIAALWVTPAFGAQGQITEVNPSGIGTVVILQADEEGEGFRPGGSGVINRNESAGTSGISSNFTSECLGANSC